MWSRSSRARGLKRTNESHLYRVDIVALFTGAWIETSCHARVERPSTVALFTGAWIETPVNLEITKPLHRRALHGRVD